MSYVQYGGIPQHGIPIQGWPVYGIPGSAIGTTPVPIPAPVPVPSGAGRIIDTYLYPLRVQDAALVMESDTVRLMVRRTSEEAEILAILQEL